MLTKVQKWGNSLTLRIPKTFEFEAQLENNSLIEISIVKGKIIVIARNLIKSIKNF